MDADVHLTGGTVLRLHDVRVGQRALTATLDGRRVSLPKDRLLAQKVLVACDRAARARASAPTVAPPGPVAASRPPA